MCKRIWRARLARVAVLITALAAAAPARAAISIVDNGEPPYTKGTGNTWWFGWNDPGSTGSDPYWVCFVLDKDGVALWGHDQHCYRPSGADTGGNTSGTISFNPTEVSASDGLLQSGHRYTVVANDYYDQCGPGCGIRADGSVSQASTTTMDTSLPSDQVSVDGPNAYTNDPTLAIHIAYGDTISPPFPGPFGGATVDCTQLGSPCSAGSYDAGCSHAETYQGLTNSFNCLVTWSGPDGKMYYCADEADSAIPDNPSGPNQFVDNSSGYANHSGYGCGWITLDRTPPVVTATGDGKANLTVTEGAAVTFSASATDTGAGPDGVYAWDFGDHTSSGTGATVTHTYTQTGTYVATVTTHDKAKTIHSASAPYYAQGPGNAGSATVTVQVNPPSASTQSLTVSKSGSGSGTVTSSPSGVDCGAICSASFAAGAQVTLSAAAASGSQFSGWSGGGCSGTGSCRVTLGADASITATFDSSAGSGSGPGSGSSSGSASSPSSGPSPSSRPSSGSGTGAAAPILRVAVARREVSAKTGFTLKVKLGAAGQIEVKVYLKERRVMRHHKHKVLVALGLLKFKGKQGVNTFAVKSLHHHKLQPGTYRLKVYTADGKATSRSHSLTLTVVRSSQSRRHHRKRQAISDRHAESTLTQPTSPSPARWLTRNPRGLGPVAV